MKKLATLFFAIITTSLFAQEFIGLHNSNYAGATGMFLQPASIADSRYKLDVQLVGFNFNTYNNYLALQGESGMTFIKEANNENGLFQESDFSDKYVFENLDGRNKVAISNQDIYFPAAMIALSEKHSIGFSWRVRNYFNVDGISEELAQLIYNSLEFPSLHNVQLEDQDISIQQMTWAQYGGTYARVMYDEGEHFLKVGGTVSVLQGMASTYMFINNVEYNFENEDTLNVFTTDVQYGHSDNIETDEGNLSYRSNTKTTLGLDIGAVYEWRPDWKDHKYDMDGDTNLWRRDRNKYKLRVGFSINDIGRIKFKKGGLSGNFFADTRDWDISNIDAESVRDFDDTLRNRFEFVQDDGEYKMALPTAISLQVDYNIYKDFYVNFTPYFAVQRRNDAHKVHTFTRLSLTPSYDWKWAGAGIPISYSTVAGTNVGLGARLGPIWLGSSNLITFLGKGKKYGADFYFALKVPIPHGKPKDEDNDKVSDKLDKCLDNPGVWEFYGCPDTDGDHIQDSEDLCPTVPGLKEFNGCPDTDGDGIKDIDDVCPETPGLEEFQGCPDTDEDGIQDSEDDCPEEAGLAEFNGCPDRDGDGLKDSDDLCPDNPGPIENQGCPDTDKDGLFDYLDGCPEVPGPRENNGCPWPDTDEDGVLDKDDKCPNNPGPKENQGCPYTDTDGDGVLDKDDDCPNVPGLVENKGCPAIQKEEQEIIDVAFANLEFETGKAVIRATSFESLNELAKLLIKKEDWTLRLEGHTDDVGSENNNLVLSKRRSESVRDYLVAQGVSADRIRAEYYGEMRPIADNDTEEGRQKNRRVEMEIEFE